MTEIISNWELAGLGVNCVLMYLVNRLYRTKLKHVNLIADSPCYEVNEGLKEALLGADDRILPFACISGVTAPVGEPIRSQYTDAVGVVQHRHFVEHKSKRTQGFWADTKNVITDQWHSILFALVNPDKQEGRTLRVEVIDPLTAEYLNESVVVTYDHFTPAASDFLSRSVDRLFGDVSKGLQETEKMLAVGVPVTGLGKVLLEGTNRMILCAPDDGPFILTTTSRPELVRSLKSEARIFRTLLWIFGVAGLAYAAYVIYRNVRKSRELRLVDEYRLRRRRRSDDTGNSSQTGGGGGATTDNDPTLCIICMEKSREVVVLDCGHICMCSDCALQLPSPKRCPVCRQAVARIIPTYIP